MFGLFLAEYGNIVLMSVNITIVGDWLPLGLPTLTKLIVTV
jgi:hypothetical protein